MKKVKMWLFYREETEEDRYLYGGRGNDADDLNMILEAYTDREDIAEAYLSSHSTLKLYQKKEKHSMDYFVEFSNMHTAQKLIYTSLKIPVERNKYIEAPIVMTLTERSIIDGYQGRLSRIFEPAFDYMNMVDKVQGALIMLGYNEFFNDAKYGDDMIHDGNSKLKSSVYVDEHLIFNQLIKDSLASRERRKQR